MAQCMNGNLLGSILASFQTIPKNAVTRIEEAETILVLPQRHAVFAQVVP